MKNDHYSIYHNYFKGILGLFFIFSTLITANGQWRHSASSGLAINEIMFVNATTGYEVGNNGQVLKTTDGGASWQSLPFGFSTSLNTVFFISATEGYVGGSELYKTIDGGNTWVQIEFGTAGNIQSIYFINSSTGWLATDIGDVYKTTDNGGTWYNYRSGTSVKAMCFTSSNVGWLVGTLNTVETTGNGGLSWNPQSVVTTNVNVVEVQFISSTEGWIAASDGTVYRTTNNGATWSSVSTGFGIYDMCFVSSTTGFISTGSGIYKSTDGGATWGTLVSSIVTSRIAFSTPTNGVASYFYNINYRTTDGGATWSPLSATTNLTTNIYGVCFTDQNTGYNVGLNGTVKKTTDGGNTWTNLTSGTVQTLLSVNFPSTTTGWFVGLAGTIRKTTDAGATWSSQTSGTTAALYASQFLSTTSGFIVGDVGKILKTTDGSTWTSLTSGTTGLLRSVYFVDANNGWIVGHGGIILSTTNGGTSWSSQTSGTTNNLLSVYFTNSTTGYAVGANGTILKTTNAGTTWTAQTSGVTNHLTSVSFTSATDGWAVGYNGTFLHTGNSGTTWNLHTRLYSVQPINQVYFMSPTKAYAVGNSGFAYQYTTNCSPSAPLNYTYTTGANVCVNTPAILKAAGVGKISWYTAASGGTYLGSGSTYTTAPLTANTSYYAQDSTCVASARTLISVTASAPPSISAAAPASNCGNGSLTLGATSGVGTILWYSALTGGSPIGTGTSFNTPVLSSTTTYYVEAKNYGCASSSRFPVVATINTIPYITSNTPGYFCISGNAALAATASAGTVKWYDVVSGGSSIGTGNNFITPSISSNTTYYAEADNNGCLSAGRTAVLASKNTVFPSIATTISGHTMRATQAGNIYQWIDCGNSSSIISGETGQTFSPTVSGSYAVIINKNGCIDTSTCKNVTGTPTATLDKSADGVVAVFPNPTTDKITIEEINNYFGGSNVSINVLDIIGNQVLQAQLQNESTEIDLASLPSGMYFIEFLSGENTYRKTIVKK